VRGVPERHPDRGSTLRVLYQSRCRLHGRERALTFCP
jgi:hypothetical protein